MLMTHDTQATRRSITHSKIDEAAWSVYHGLMERADIDSPLAGDTGRSRMEEGIMERAGILVPNLASAVTLLSVYGRDLLHLPPYRLVPAARERVSRVIRDVLDDMLDEERNN